MVDYKKRIAMRYFDDVTDVAKRRVEGGASRYLEGAAVAPETSTSSASPVSPRMRVWDEEVSYFFRALLVLYVLFLILFVYIYGLGIGSNATLIWLQISLVALLLDMCLLIPFKIWLKHVGVAMIVSTDVRMLHYLLRSRAKAIMLRRAGLIRNANALVQHFNPACRAARAYPHLASARLLMSLNDFDLPANTLLSNKEKNTKVPCTKSYILTKCTPSKIQIRPSFFFRSFIVHTIIYSHPLYSL
jgi:hypothetical protein